MNLSDTLQLLDKLAQVGATHFKSPELELEMNGHIPAPPQNKVEHAPEAPPHPSPALPSQAAENTRKAQALLDMLKMKDEELVNQIFPEGA